MGNKKKVKKKKKNVKKKNNKKINATKYENNKYPFVSICTPSYKRKEYIKILKECVLSQDYPLNKMEWIVFDDSPKEELREILKDVSICKYIYNPNKLILSKKRNIIHNFCKGDIIIYMDSDDFYFPTRVSHAVDLLIKNPKIMVVGSSKLFIYYTYRDKIYETKLINKNHATAATLAFKKELLLQTRYDDDKHFAEEKNFLKNYSFPMIQLNPLKTLLVIVHDKHTIDKEQCILEKEKFNILETDLKLEDLLNKRKLEKLKKAKLNIDVRSIIKKYKSIGRKINYNKKNNIIPVEKKKIISFCLWGDNKMYTKGAIYNVLLAKKIYPGWVCRFYIPHPTYKTYKYKHPSYNNSDIADNMEESNNVPLNIITELKKLGAEIIFVKEDGTYKSFFWRMRAIDDPEVNIMIVRDCDSRLTYRERKAVDYWLKSKKQFHIMRDHNWHTTEILGAMWGIKKNGSIKNISDILDYKDIKKCNVKYGIDQKILKEKIYPLIKNDCIIHDEIVKYEKNCLSFPSKRHKNQYVGQPYNENNLSLISMNRDMLHKNKDYKEKFEIDALNVIINTGFLGSESWYIYETLLKKIFGDYVYINKNPDNTESYDAADIVFYGSRTHIKNKKENERVKYIYLSIEPHNYNNMIYDLLIDTKICKEYDNFEILSKPETYKIIKKEKINKKKKFIYFPHYSLSFLSRKSNNVNDLIKKYDIKELNNIYNMKKNFCAMICTEGSDIKRKLYNKLSKYRKVHSMGKFLNNFKEYTLKDRFSYDENGRELFYDNCVDIYKKYKFVLCIENEYNKNNRKHYITEKIINVMLANSIPIYKGSKNIADHFNENSFINIDNYDNYDDLLTYIKKLDKNKKLYIEKLNEPWCKNNLLNHYLDWHNNFITHEITKKIKKFIFNTNNI